MVKITLEEIKFGIFLVITIVTANLMTEPITEFLKKSFPQVNPFFIGVFLFLITALFFNARRLGK